MYILQDGLWIKDECHALSIDGLYNNQGVFINGGKLKAYQNGTIDLSGDDPTCPEC